MIKFVTSRLLELLSIQLIRRIENPIKIITINTKIDHSICRYWKNKRIHKRFKKIPLQNKWWKLLIGENNKEEQTHVENRPYNLKHNWWDIDRGHFFLLYKRNNKKPMFQGYEKTNKSNKTIIKKHIIWFPSSQQWEDW